MSPRLPGRVGRALQRLDERLLALPGAVRYLAVGLTLAVMVGWSLPHVPRAYYDFSSIGWLRGVEQPEEYGTDTIADMYAAKVILHDVTDMYTRRGLEQTPLEARTWSKAASSPYPPLTLLALAGLYAIGEATGLGLYGIVLILAAAFVLLSAAYFLRTRWYLFPILYLNFAYFSERFVSVQDGSYLLMLNVVMAALLVAEARPAVAHALMALGAAIKLLPGYHVVYARELTWPARVAVLCIFAAGFVLPYWIWDNYLYIYTFNAGNKGDVVSTLSGLAVAALVTWLLRRVERTGLFDREERIGWALVPIAVFLAVKTNAARHLLMALIVPDKRGPRNIAAAVGLALFALFPSVVRLGSLTYICTAILMIWLASRGRATSRTADPRSLPAQAR